MPDGEKDFFDFIPGSRPEEGEVERPAPGDVDELIAKRDGTVYVEMTLTTPHCPVAGSMPGRVEEAARSVEGVKEARVKLVWTPPWTQDRMTDEAKLELGLL